MKRALSADTNFLFNELKLKGKIGNKLKYKREEKVPEPLLYAIAECDNSEIDVDLFGTKIKREGIASAIIGIDFLVFTIFIFGYNFINRFSKDFVT